MSEPTTPAARAVAKLPGARYHAGALGLADAYEVDCPTCGPGATLVWSLTDWCSLFVLCRCNCTPISWALRMGLRPALLDADDRRSRLRFDDDGLRSALKSTRDAVASLLKLDDASPLIRFDYAQARGRRGEHAVHIRIEIGGAT